MRFDKPIPEKWWQKMVNEECGLLPNGRKKTLYLKNGGGGSRSENSVRLLNPSMIKIQCPCLVHARIGVTSGPPKGSKSKSTPF